MILEIIAEQDIETQDELCEELVKRNFNVTQATISSCLLYTSDAADD